MVPSTENSSRELQREGASSKSALDAVFAPTFDIDPDDHDGGGGFFLPGATSPTPQSLSGPTPPTTVTWKGALAYLGPAFLVSVGYLDPGNWATDIEGGSRFGYKLLWVLLLSNVMALLLQTLAARMGIVTRSHLSELCRDEYPRWATVVLWVLAELAILATDLTEVLGTAIGLNLVFRIPLVVAVVLTGLDTFLLLAVQNHGMRKLEQVMFFFLAVISVCFIAELFFSQPSLRAIAAGAFVPRLSRESLYIAVGIIGATVMPHNFYLHSAIVVDRGATAAAPAAERRVPTSRAAIASECKYALIDTALALNAALFINAAILIIAAANFWTQGVPVHTLQKAHDLLQKVGFEVGPVDMAQLLFGLALIASGQSSTLCGTLAGQYVMEGFLDLRGPAMVRRLATRMVALVPAMLTILAMGDEGTYRLLIYSQVVLSLQLPFAIIPMIKFTGSRTRMGEFANPRGVHALAWASAWLTVGLNVWLVYETLVSAAAAGESRPHVRALVVCVAAPVAVCLMVFLGYIVVRRERNAVPFVNGVEESVEDLLADTPDVSPGWRGGGGWARAGGDGREARHVMQVLPESSAR